MNLIMKLRYLFSIVLSTVLLFAGCVKEGPTGSYDNIKLSQSYLSISEKGGSVEVTLTATEAWNFVVSKSWPEVIETDKEGNETKRTPSWLSAASVMSGEAGEYKITFSAEASANGHEIDIEVKAGSNTQILRVRQGSLEASSATCAEIIAGPDGKTYRTKGTCTAIANTTYGNWYLQDATGEVYIYGTLDAKGAEKNFSSLGIEVGDVVEVEGPKTTYGSTIELVNVTVIKITKSLAKVLTESKTYPIEGGEFGVKVAYKGSNFSPSVPEEYRDWASVVDVKTIAGVPSKIETNPADTAVVTVKLFPNAGGDRKGQINFTSGSSKVFYEFTQAGAVIDATVAEFLAAAENDTQYRVTGVIRSVSASTKYHNADLVIAGGLGETVTIYRAVTKEGNIEDLGLEVGDMVTFVGKRSSHNGTPQMAQGGVYVSHERYTKATVAEFLAAEESNVVYAVSGEIVEIKELSDKYNNVGITIKDGDNSVYLHRVTTFDKSSVVTLNPQVGGKITVAGKRGSYNGTPQMAAGGICLEYTAPTGEKPENPGEDVKSESIVMANCFSAATTFEVGTTYKMGSLSCSYDHKDGTSATNYNAGDSGVRFYAHDVLTFSAEKEIAKLEFVLYGGKKGPVKVNTGVVENGETSIVWTGSAKSISFDATAQVRFNEIKVSYK